jgi:hypothetical protein
MISAAKLAANRANAKKSTGPRTQRGKRRSSQNARRHGLTMPAKPEDETAIAELAHAIAHAQPQLLAAAARIASAQHDVERARRARLDLLAKAESGAADGKDFWRLAACDRYEQRARTRRASALYRFDLLARFFRDPRPMPIAPDCADPTACQFCQNEPTRGTEKPPAANFAKTNPPAFE